MNKNFISVIFLPFIFVSLMWLVKIYEWYFDLSFSEFGVLPKDILGLQGIVFSPFIHQDFSHLFNNSYPIIILGILLFYFYKNIAIEIFLWLFFISGLFLWVVGRPSYHIGASGLIYALASFLFLSGLIKKNPRLAAVSLIVTFLYGSMIWGVFPLKVGVSWEGHLCGLISGILVALFYKNQGPKRKKYDWELEEEDTIEVNYILKEN